MTAPISTYELLKLHTSLTEEARKLMEKKNTDYRAVGGDPFGNFRMARLMRLLHRPDQLFDPPARASRGDRGEGRREECGHTKREPGEPWSGRGEVGHTPSTAWTGGSFGIGSTYKRGATLTNPFTRRGISPFTMSAETKLHGGQP